MQTIKLTKRILTPFSAGLDSQFEPDSSEIQAGQEQANHDDTNK